MRSLVVRADIVDYDARRRSTCVSEKSTEERLHSVSDHPVNRMRASDCVWKDAVSCVRGDHACSILRHFHAGRSS
jgi:hypothetical protein